MSVFVCIPTARDIHGLTTAAAFRICAGHAGGAEFKTYQAQPTDYCRNLCVQDFLRTGHSHLLFIDSDVLPPDACLDLMLSVNRPLVCGMYPLLLDDSNICVSVAERTASGAYRFLTEFPDEPFEADAAGMGCCLIRRDVFDAIGYPWFKFQQREDCKLTGEDIHFFEQCARADVRPLVLPEVLCSHFKMVDLLEVLTAVHQAKRAGQGRRVLTPVGG
jgi:hypothetical protein